MKNINSRTLLNIPLLILFLINFNASRAKYKIDFNNRRFGPYYMITRSVVKCNTPGPVDTENQCSNNFSIYKINRIKEEFRGVMVIPHDIPRFSATVTVDLWRDGGFKSLYKNVFDNACEDPFYGVFLKTYFNVTKNCVVRKGSYNFDGVEAYEVVSGVIGDNFFYERMSLVISWLTKKGSITCIKIALDSRPLPKNLHHDNNPNKTVNTFMKFYNLYIN